jgi:ATP-dependent DNA helicase DinG
LIRDESDRGLIVLYDPRLRGKAYGRKVLASLPPMPVLNTLDGAVAWLKAAETA